MVLLAPFILAFATVVGVSVLASALLNTNNGCSTTATTTPASLVSTGSPSAQETANVRTIIGVAKTENLPPNAEIAALATMMNESNGLVLANQTVPLSETSPLKQGDGNNGSSLGIFQQQITFSWSTYTTNDRNNQDAVTQLMTAAYEAEAYYGAPPNSALPGNLADPGALRKGIQYNPDYAAAMAGPGTGGIAQMAESTQAPLNAGAYINEINKNIPAAQALVTANQDAPPVPLPVPVSTTGTGATTPGGSAAGSSTTPTAPASVLVVGDSITVGGQPALTANLTGASITPTFADKVGMGLSFFMDPSTPTNYIPDLVRSTNPGLLVIALGTNDSGDSATYAQQISALFTAIPTTQPVLWVLPYYQDIQPGSSSAHIVPGLQSLDGVIAAQTASHPNMTTLDMNAIFGTNASYIGSDGLHPSAAGSTVWANAISESIQSSATLVSATTPSKCASVTATAAPGGSPQARQAVATAESEVGVPYLWGGTTPSGFDCSGLMLYAYAKAGITLPRTSEAQYDLVKRAGGLVQDPSQLQPGDLVFYNPGEDGIAGEPGHVVMYVGNNMTVQAPYTGKTVFIGPLTLSGWMGGGPVPTATPT